MTSDATSTSTFPEESLTNHKTQSSQSLATLLAAILVPVIGILMLCCCCLRHRRVAKSPHREKRGIERPFYAPPKAGRMGTLKNRTNDYFEVLSDVGGSDSEVDSVFSDAATVPTRSSRSPKPVTDGSGEKAVSNIPVNSFASQAADHGEAAPSQDIFGERLGASASVLQRWNEFPLGRSQGDLGIMLTAMTERSSTQGEEGPPCYDNLFPGFEGSNIV